MTAKPFALAGLGAATIAGAAAADLVRATAVNVGDIGAGADTWKIYLVFDDDQDALLGVGAIARISPLVFDSPTDLIQNCVLPDSALCDVKGPLDLGGDSWVNIGEEVGDTRFSPNFLNGDGKHSVIKGNFFSQPDNGGYYDSNPGTPVLPDANDRILIAQFTFDLAPGQAATFRGVAAYVPGAYFWKRFDIDPSTLFRAESEEGFVSASFAVAVANVSGSVGGCCISPSLCYVTTEDICTDGLGGVYLGDGVECQLQRIAQEIEEPGGEIVIHGIQVIVNCPDPGAGPRACQEGPRIDAWESRPGATCHRFGVEGSPPIPGDYFGPGSDPFTDAICLRGVPLGPVDIDDFEDVDFGEADTLIRRSADPFDRCTLPGEGDEQTVYLEIEALSLRSVDPIIVTFDGGRDAELWDVAVDLSVIHTDEDRKNDPPLGSLTATRTHCSGGRYTSLLFVSPRFTFTKLDDPKEVRVLDSGLEEIPPVMLDARNTPQPWVHDLDAGYDNRNPFCTGFHPGFEQPKPKSECDCNGNQVRDRCDIDEGRSDDRNRNGIPDECECVGDVTLDGSVGDLDVIAILDGWGQVEGCPPFAPEDIDVDCVIGYEDLLLVLAHWGACK